MTDEYEEIGEFIHISTSRSNASRATPPSQASKTNTLNTPIIEVSTFTSLPRKNVLNRESVLMKQLADDEDTTPPSSVRMMEKTVVRMADVVQLHESSLTDRNNYFYTTIPADFASWHPVFLRQTRDEKELRCIVNETVGEWFMKEPVMHVIEEFDQIISFPVVVTGFIAPGDYPTFFMVDCLNYNGKNIEREPYEFRLHRLHEIASLLYSDSFKMLPMKTGSEFFKDAVTGPFIIIDARHVNSRHEYLLSFARFVSDGEKIDESEVLFGIVEEPRSEIPVDAGIVVETEEKERTTFKHESKRIFVTGRVPGVSREKVKELLEANGAVYHPRVNKKLDLLVVASNPGVMIVNNAKSLGITIMEWNEFAGDLF